MSKLFPNVLRSNFLDIDSATKEKILKQQKGRCFFTKEPLKLKEAFFVKFEGEIVSCNDMSYYCLNLNLVDLKKQGNMVLIPELSQEEIFYLLKIIEASKFINNKFDEQKEIFVIIKDFLINRKEAVAKVYTPLMNDPNFYIQVVMEMENKKDLEKGFYGIRWLPDMSFFEDNKEKWKDEMEVIINPSKWKRFYSKVVKKISTSTKTKSKISKRKQPHKKAKK